jgi:glutamate N-acetyltransferase/amino-acid N-acetyltransferase
MPRASKSLPSNTTLPGTQPGEAFEPLPAYEHHRLPPAQPPGGVTIIDQGGVTSPTGFIAGASYAGIKTLGVAPLDVAILASEVPARCAAVFTRSTVPGAPVIVSRLHARTGSARGVVINSGVANVGTGKRGEADARKMCEVAGRAIGCEASELLVGSTGVIGRHLPIEKITSTLPAIDLSPGGGAQFARAIMTTDTHPKSLAVSFRANGREYHIGAAAKGSGMIHPDMATMFCFITTDAPVEKRFLRTALKAAVDVSLNMVSVDGDTSTSDTTAIFANGNAGGAQIGSSSAARLRFQLALTYVCTEMAKMIARDGEGAEKLIEVRIEGAATAKDARAAARTVTASPLLKSAVHGNDPNWGRLLMAIGRSYARVNLERARAWVGNVQVYNRGIVDFDQQSASHELRREHVVLRVDLGAGRAAATAWGCDLTPEYVHINADYTT